MPDELDLIQVEMFEGLVMLSGGEASLVLETEILRYACGLAQDDIRASDE